MANQNTNGGQERKFYTFLALTRSIDKNGNPYIGVTVHGPVRKPDDQLGATNNGNPVYHFTMPIQNRDQYIADMASALAGQQVNPDVTDDGTILARVSMFGKTAERFVAFREKHPYADVCVVGALSTRAWTDNNGGGHTAVEIAAFDFFLVRELQPPKSQQQGGYVPQAQAPQQTGYAPQQGGWPQQQPQTAPTPTPMPQQQGGWPQQQPQAAPAPAPMPQQQPPQAQLPQRNAEGFFDMSDDDGELPF